MSSIWAGCRTVSEGGIVLDDVSFAQYFAVFSVATHCQMQMPNLRTDHHAVISTLYACSSDNIFWRLPKYTRIYHLIDEFLAVWGFNDAGAEVLGVPVLFLNLELKEVTVLAD